METASGLIEIIREGNPALGGTLSAPNALSLSLNNRGQVIFRAGVTDGAGTTQQLIRSANGGPLIRVTGEGDSCRQRLQGALPRLR